MRDVRADFPLLARHPGLVYLDSACTSLKPKSVIEAESAYYTDLGACGSRSSHQLGRQTSEKMDMARETVAKFVGAKSDELIWTRNTTEGLNLVVNGLDYSARRKVVTTVMEHHSVLLPLMRLRDEGKITLGILPANAQGEVAMTQWQNAVDRSTALVVSSSDNNTTGEGKEVKALAKLAHDQGALVCIDGAQGVPHHPSSVGGENVDFLCFSAHKMLGPTGIGALVARKGVQEKLRPLLVGGGTVKTVSLQKVVVENDQSRFEAGIQHYAGMLGFAAACDYLKKLGMENVLAHEKMLHQKLRDAVLASGARIYENPKATRQGALCLFNFPKAKPHDVGLMLDQKKVAVRSGYFCAQPALDALGAKEGAVRASGYIYNNDEDVRKFAEALQNLKVLYG